MLNFGNKEFRNLQEQVFTNMNNIEALQQGIKIIGYGTSLPETLNEGEGYLFGEQAPYELYLGVNGSIVNLGDFPKQGPQGIQGQVGPMAVINAIETHTITLDPGMEASVSATTQNNYIRFDFEVPTGPQGIQGPQGPRGIQGPKGDTGGTPKGVFATVAALEAAYPTGNDNIYVVLADGHWYYYDGGWQDGGAYLAITSDSITYDQLNAYLKAAVDKSLLTYQAINNILLEETDDIINGDIDTCYVEGAFEDPVYIGYIDESVSSIQKYGANLYEYNKNFPAYSFGWNSQITWNSTIAARAVPLKAGQNYRILQNNLTSGTWSVQIHFFDLTAHTLHYNDGIISGSSSGYWQDASKSFIFNAAGYSSYLALTTTKDCWIDLVSTQGSPTAKCKFLGPRTAYEAEITDYSAPETISSPQIGDKVPYSPYCTYVVNYTEEVEDKELQLLFFKQKQLDVQDLQDQIDDINDRIDNLLVSYQSGSFIVSADSMAAGDSITIPKTNIIKNRVIDISADITSFNNDGYILLAHGSNSFGGGYLKIDKTNLYIQYNNNNENITTLAHGMTFENNIQVRAEVSNTSYVKVQIVSNGNSYTTPSTYLWTFNNNGNETFSTNGVALANVVVGTTCKDMNAKAFLMGDSYLGLTSQAGWPARLHSMGYTNFLVNAYPGETSGGGIAALNNILQVAKPKAIVWCYGMNDGADSSSAVNATWLSQVNTFLTKCEENNIEPILATVPSVPSGRHDKQNEWVRESGYRYVDIARAVGAQSNGTWYEGMLGNDNIHPSTKGALAIAMRVLADCPEITQFNS